MIFNNDDPTLKQFLDDMLEISNDCMTSDGNISGHTFPAHIYVDDGSDAEYVISALEIDYMGGCSCPSGITIKIKKWENTDANSDR